MIRFIKLVFICAVILFSSEVFAQADANFTYQGELKENGSLATGTFFMDFTLWDAPNAGNQIGSTISFIDVLVTDGKFSVELDFGAAAFDNGDRWLEIVVNGVNLDPRNKITRAPYAIQTRGVYVADDEDVSIGTTSTPYKFQVFTDDRPAAIFGDNFDNSAGDKYGVYGRATSVEGYGVYGLHDALTGTNAGVYGETDSTSNNAVAVHGVLDATSPGSFSAAVRGENRGTGFTGIGVHGSHDGEGWGVYGSTQGGFGRGVFGEVLGGGGIAGYFSNDDSIAVFANGVDNDGTSSALTVASGSQTMYIDGNEIDSDFSGGLYLNNNNNHDVIITAGGGGLVVGSNDLIALGVPAITTRTYSDSVFIATHIQFDSGGMIIGDVTSLGGNVSYNAFTGSHYVSIPAPIEAGTLVRMTGVNHSMSEVQASEPVYGVEPTSRANDPACLGAYLGGHGDLHTTDGTPIHLVTAVGNGTMCVGDDGRGNIEPGDLLISSDTPGCAMKDDPRRFATSYVIARAAEPIDWTEVSPDPQGMKRAKISVLFDATVRTTAVTDYQRELERLRITNDKLSDRLSSLESMLHELTMSDINR